MLQILAAFGLSELGVQIISLGPVEHDLGLLVEYRYPGGAHGVSHGAGEDESSDTLFIGLLACCHHRLA